MTDGISRNTVKNTVFPIQNTYDQSQNTFGLGQINENIEEKMNKYVCKICDLKTNHKSHYESHLLTSRHKKNVKYVSRTNGNTNAKGSYYDCPCGKSYNHRQSLYTHKKKCEYKETPGEKVVNNIDENVKINPTSDHDIVKELIKQNQYLIMENQDFKKMMMEMISKPSANIINTNSHNKQFNLQFFLNETCKNAMNLSDFVNSIVIQASELEDIGKLGYVQGISNIMIRSLKELDETERPFHCTDKKREVIYIKENNIWEKETSDRAKLYQFVKDIAYRNFKRMPEWEKDNPKYEDITTKKHLEYIRMLNQVMTGLDPEELGVNKIIRNLSAHVYLDK